MRSRRRPSFSFQKCIILSYIVFPGTSRTPPVITSQTSPAAWAPTIVMVREKRMVGFDLHDDESLVG